MLKKIVFTIIGFIFGYLIGFPYGIYYTVEANDNYFLLKAISVIKAVIGL
ncbi:MULTISPECIES: hypothetical protein [Niallia]|nr:hypothetical protein [Niallia circulans]